MNSGWTVSCVHEEYGRSILNLFEKKQQLYKGFRLLFPRLNQTDFYDSLIDALSMCYCPCSYAV